MKGQKEEKKEYLGTLFKDLLRD